MHSLLVLLACVFPVFAFAQANAPVFKDIRVSAAVTLDSATGEYRYAYRLENPATNTAAVQKIFLDITVAGAVNTGGPEKINLDLANSGLPRPTAPISPEAAPFKSYLRGKLKQGGKEVLPVALSGPAGWLTNGATVFATAGWSNIEHVANLGPGQSLDGFVLSAPRFVPTLRTIRVSPNIRLLGLYPDADDDDDVVAAKRAYIKSLDSASLTLGPSGADLGSFAHWNRLRDDLTKAVQLGWFPDAALANALATQLSSARAALDQQDLYLVHQRLATLLATISKSTPVQRTTEGYGLVYFNVKAMIDSTNYNTEEPEIKLTPGAAAYPLGATHTLTARVVDLANGSRPMAGMHAYFYVDSGPNQGDIADSETDAEGVAVGSYTGMREGVDNIRVRIDYCGGECSIKASAAARWEGGADLAVPVFTPPVLITAGGRNFFLTDATENMGNVAAPPSVTRYYIYPNRNFDPSTAQVVGERAVPALKPDEASLSGKQTFVVPANLPAGTYYLAACADANSNVVELDETNNCSFNTLERRISIIQVMESPKNQPPVCSLAMPSVATLWPPNHKLVDIAMLGITDPDNDPVSIKITAITQDEPVNGLGDGDTAPDGFGVGTIQAQVRAERSGTGNGRVYAISFMADDGKGGTCSGKVSVGVPQDQGQGSVPVDDGQNYDSTGI